MKVKLICLITGLGWLFLSCDLNKSLTPEINYNTRTTEYWTYVDAAETVFDPVRTFVYDSAGRLAGEFRQIYNSDGLNTRTDVFAYDTAGNPTQNEYYIYKYTQLAGDTTNWYITDGETYDMNDTKQLWYTVTWDPVYYEYTTINDYKNDDGATVQTAGQVCTYLKAPGTPVDGQYRTEQYFYYDGGTKKMSKEYACWYDSSTGDYTHELYHVIRGEETDIVPEGQDAAYFYVPFSRNGQGYVYLQSDYYYDETASPVPKEADTSFTVTPANPDPLLYDMDFAGIRDMADMLLINYDNRGNPDKKTFYTYGRIQEIIYFAYDEDNRETDRSRYVNEGQKIEEKTVTRYRNETIEGKEYLVKDIYVYRFGEDYTADLRAARPEAEKKMYNLKKETFRKVKPNHTNF